ncbi:MAG: PHP domain-containing protein [Treponema sp.]|nr:PHP domain-containing protein [Treponema sp.]
MIDLHTHSTASDGSFSPSALMKEAAKHSISAIALTDHDTVNGLEEAAQTAGELGIRFIPGVELEIIWREDSSYAGAVNAGGEFHLLGLGLNRLTPDFLAAVEELARRREERNLEIVDRMNKAGIAASYDEIRVLAGVPESHGPMDYGHSIGRPHFAAFLAKRKIVRNREQAFTRYLGRGKPFYIPKAGLEFERAVTAIHGSGGIAVLAHPMSLYVSWGRLPDLIKNLKEKGLDGLEAWHPSTKVSACKRLEALGKSLGLSVTAGSDFHGEARPDRKLGITAGGKKIDEALINPNIPLFLSQD